VTILLVLFVTYALPVIDAATTVLLSHYDSMVAACLQSGTLSFLCALMLLVG